ncbi:hypothetical protein VOM14_16555 [Paraburkholderia sp. MPAMCS5]|uniref:hypothetical protein n=1 Tax=Paraburkholderia sp. MPAMCS5 TaxID=3112563 RepID=UPI002E18C304|nr:hypothetical protein [Paraburkholderia sp. MPAMCS5]
MTRKKKLTHGVPIAGCGDLSVCGKVLHHFAKGAQQVNHVKISVNEEKIATRCNWGFTLRLLKIWISAYEMRRTPGCPSDAGRE